MISQLVPAEVPRLLLYAGGAGATQALFGIVQKLEPRDLACYEAFVPNSLNRFNGKGLS